MTLRTLLLGGIAAIDLTLPARYVSPPPIAIAPGPIRLPCEAPGFCPGADVVIGADGLASGELREFAAMDSVGCLAASGGRESLGLSGQETAGVNHATRAQDIATLRDALQACAELGITSVCNMDGNLYQARLLGEMADKGQIDPDISLPMTQMPGMTDDRRHAFYDQAMAPPAGQAAVWCRQDIHGRRI